MDKGNTFFVVGGVRSQQIVYVFSELFPALSCVKLLKVYEETPPVSGQLLFKKKKKSLIQPSVLKGISKESRFK